MLKVFVTATFKGTDNKLEIEKLCNYIKQAGLEDFCFVRDVEHYQKIFSNSHQLMHRTLDEIKGCDALLINYDGPASGRMVELGIAYSLGKKIVIIKKHDFVMKDTIAGVSDLVISYEDLSDIVRPLSEFAKVNS